MDKQELLVLLEEPLIVKKIQQIIDEHLNGRPDEGIDMMPLDIGKQDTGTIDNIDTEMAMRIEELLSEKYYLESELKQVITQVEEQRKVIATAQEQYAVLHRQYRKIEEEKQEIADQCRELEVQLAEYKNRLWQADENQQSLRDEVGSLKHTTEQLQAELTTRFADGWELYHKYQTIDEAIKDNLIGVFPRGSFESFICGGAKEKSLEKLWDETSRCLTGSSVETAYILWDIFGYFINLVNESKTEDVYQIDTVNIGDEYNIELHRLTAGSKVQGTVKQIYLPGYSNLYNETNVRKSIVHVE